MYQCQFNIETIGIAPWSLKANLELITVFVFCEFNLKMNFV